MIFQSPCRPACTAPAKLAYAVDDVWEEVIRRAQTGLTLRDLFGLAADVELLRDRRSPDDEVIGDRDDASFDHGCVFKTRKVVAPPPSVDTSRADIDAISNKLKGRKIGIIGLGGTCGHLSPIDQPEPLAGAIRTFVRTAV